MPKKKKKIAVIFVPGIFASHLIRNGQLPHPWPVNDLEAMAKIMMTSPVNKREIMQDSKNFVVHGNNPKVGAKISNMRTASWLSVLNDSYWPFLSILQNGPNTLDFEPVVWAAGYNFTQSNLDSARKNLLPIVNKALEEEDIKNFIIVSHSMGALTTRAFLIDKSAFCEQCIGVIHVAAPNGGAPEFIMRYFQGVQKPNSRPVRILFGQTGWRVATVASAIPGAYELFPFAADPAITFKRGSNLPPQNDPFFIQAITQFAFSDSNKQKPSKLLKGRDHYGPAKAILNNEIIPDIAKYMQAAENFHKYTLRNKMFWKTAAVCLKGVNPTVQNVNYKLVSGNRMAEAHTNEFGDGTVPVWSQKMFLDGKKIREDSKQSHDAFVVIEDKIDGKPVEHQDALNSPKAQKEIFKFMNIFYKTRHEQPPGGNWIV